MKGATTVASYQIRMRDNTVDIYKYIILLLRLNAFFKLRNSIEYRAVLWFFASVPISSEN